MDFSYNNQSNKIVKTIGGQTRRVHENSTTKFNNGYFIKTSHLTFSPPSKKDTNNNNNNSNNNKPIPLRDVKTIYDVVQDLRQLHLWKLTRPRKNIISFMPCRQCKQRIYEDPNKFFVPPSNTFVDIHLRLCRTCVINGLRASDAWYYNEGPGKAKQAKEIKTTITPTKKLEGPTAPKKSRIESDEDEPALMIIEDGEEGMDLELPKFAKKRKIEDDKENE